MSLASSSSAVLLLTAPTAVHVVPPSIEYCQLPLVEVRPVIAIPFTAPASTSLMLAPMNDETVCPGSLTLLVWSSVIAVSVGLIGVNTGASLTLATVRCAVSVAVENAVVPPLALVSAVVPWLPAVSSHAR